MKKIFSICLFALIIFTCCGYTGGETFFTEISTISSLPVESPISSNSTISTV